MRTISREKLPCKYHGSHTENASPHGSGENWPMVVDDCGNEDGAGESPACDETCKGYEAMEVAVCDKHNTEYLWGHGCGMCMEEAITGKEVPPCEDK